jgi:hypothetical protein
LKSLKEQGEDFVYILAGQCKPHEYDVFQDIADFNLQENVVVTGFLSGDDFFKYLVASDFIVNLRYPSGGESSGTLTRAMGLGLACLVVNIGPFAEIPDDCAIKLNYDADFDANLTKALSELMTDQQMRVQIGLAGRRWVELTQEISVTTQSYLDVVAKVANELNESVLPSIDVSEGLNTYWYEYVPLSHVRDFTTANKSELAKMGKLTRHWWLQSMLPVYDGHNLLVVSESNTILNLIENLFEYPASVCSFTSSDDFSENQNQKLEQIFNRFVLNLPVRLIEVDPVAVLCQLNSQLEIGATGCFTLYWDSEVENEVELSRTALINYIEAAGFSVSNYVTGTPDIDLVGVADTLDAHQQEWCFVLTKCSRMVNVNPQPYYSGECSELKLLKQSKNTQQQSTQGVVHDE